MSQVVAVRGVRALVALAVVLASGVGLPASATAAASAARSAPSPAPGEWWWDALGIDALHERGRGSGVTVALVDTPIDPGVPELAGRVASSVSLCLGPDRSPLSPSATGPAAEHGTSMAALIVGSGEGTAAGGGGIRGIAPDATLRHYAVGYPDASGDLTCAVDEPGQDEVAAGVVEALRAAVRDGADIVSISLTTAYDPGYAAALLEAYRAGVIVVAGVDNSSRSVKWPANGNGVVAVNPVGEDGRITGDAVPDAANLGFAAPGDDVMAGAYPPSGWQSGVRAGGSSVATALVAGGLAAVWSAHRTATADQVLQAARATVGLRRSDAGVETWFRREGGDLPQVQRSRAYGWGILSPADAVASDPSALAGPNPMLVATGGAEPTSAEVEAVLAGVPRSDPRPATGAASPPTTGEASEVAPSAAESPWARVALVLALFAAAAVGVAALLAAGRRRAARHPNTGDGTDGAHETDDTTTGSTSADPAEPRGRRTG